MRHCLQRFRYSHFAFLVSSFKHFNRKAQLSSTLYSLNSMSPASKWTKQSRDTILFAICYAHKSVFLITCRNLKKLIRRCVSSSSTRSTSTLKLLKLTGKFPNDLHKLQIMSQKLCGIWNRSAAFAGASKPGRKRSPSQAAWGQVSISINLLLVNPILLQHQENRFGDFSASVWHG